MMRRDFLQAFGRELPGTLVFDYPAVPALAAHLYQLLAAGLATSAAQSHPTAPLQLTSATLSAQLAAAQPGRAGPLPMALTISSRTLPLIGAYRSQR